MKNRLVIGSRESRLAVIQSEMVMNFIKEHCPDMEVSLLTMKTTGDKILDKTLDQVGGKGLFVKELDAALLDGRVDITVHSSKDLPMEIDSRLPLEDFIPGGFHCDQFGLHLRVTAVNRFDHDFRLDHGQPAFPAADAYFIHANSSNTLRISRCV